MRHFAKMALLAGAFGLLLATSASAQSDKKLTILDSGPDLAFPFFVHMMNQMKAEAEKLGNIEVIRVGRPALIAEADGRRGSGDHSRRRWYRDLAE